MNRYTIHCTEAQTRKALELGAPISSIKNAYTRDDIPHFTNGKVGDEWTLYFIPTSEQMIGWLEEQDDIEEITIQRNRAFHSWAYLVTNKQNKLVSLKNIYQFRKEATLAAIDAALDYLITDKTKQE